MITDSEDPDYRMPQPNERWWHKPWARWVTIEPTPAGSEWLIGLPDEVAASWKDGPLENGPRVHGSVKLRSLHPALLTSRCYGCPRPAGMTGSASMHHVACAKHRE